MARIVDIEGLDQSGKQTQARLLVNRLRRTGASASIISFPIYRSSTGRQIRRYLMDGPRPSPETLHMLYSLNRWENKELLDKLVRRSDFVIADRYSPSNLAYGSSQGLSLEWLQSLDKGLPKSDLVIVLDVPVESSFARKSSKRDAYERDRRLLNKVRGSYVELARKLRWDVVDGTRPVQQVHEVIWKILVDKFNIPHNWEGLLEFGLGQKA